MTNLLFFDTETTGYPLWTKPSDHPGQPHICQLAATLTDESGKRLAIMNQIIRPDGWTIPDDAAEIHGITTERARQAGIDANEALVMFMELWERSSQRVGFNEAFDARMVRIALKRHIKSSERDDAWKAGKSYCAMKGAAPICKIPNAKGTGTKNPTLTQAYFHFTGKEHVDAHDAMADVLATEAVYFGIRAQRERIPAVTSDDESMPDF